jgi:NADH-ubiquinone oxidoreductase chain 4
MFNRIAFAGSFFIFFWKNYIPDLNKREFNILLALVLFTVILGIYPAVILDGLHYSTYSVLFTFDGLTYENINKMQ